jgi:hypothetical protein
MYFPHIARMVNQHIIPLQKKNLVVRAKKKQTLTSLPNHTKLMIRKISQTCRRKVHLFFNVVKYFFNQYADVIKFIPRHFCTLILYFDFIADAEFCRRN